MEHLKKDATDWKADVNSQLKKSEERAAQLKQDSTLNRALMRGKRRELTTFDVNTNEMRCECQMRNSTERNTQTEEKLEDKFERKQG